MTENPETKQKHDRLFAFLQAFPLEAHPSDTIESANLLIAAIPDAQHPTHIFYRPRTGGSLGTMVLLATASLDFGGHCNPLVDALPQEIVFELAAEPQLAALSELFMTERSFSRCGSGFIGKRLSEILVIYAIRRAIAEGTVTAGLLAGLAHSELHACLVSMHDDPTRPWRVKELAELSGMSRSRFMREFAETVGRPPLAYLARWRLTLAQLMLSKGYSVKVAAGRVGFGSASALSRAFSRHFGYAPSEIGKHHRPLRTQ
ncbi:AraC family transcriptional regulator [Shinella zoogloeoides]|uniref:helix-turn-helix transcriptional regulator n=1 Tax=Shinella zoogloeoides TaxID=352475 RepID=UPI00299DEAE3|nr:AraC family transcriptional regulator [Shinella zoogloeoides]WPE22674.1 hypothetical protein ShzoTeo12_38910 [Shinella zoogloeoides]